MYPIYLSYLSMSVCLACLSILSISPSLCLSVFHWSTCYRFPFAIFAGLLRRHVLNPSASSPSQFLFPLPVFFVVVGFLPVDQVIIRQGHLLSCMRATCPYHFNVFSLLSKIVLPPFFSLITSFVTLSGLEVNSALVRKSISELTVFFSWNCGSVFWSYPFRAFSYH